MVWESRLVDAVASPGRQANRLLVAATGSVNPQLRAIIQLLLLLGARKGELLSAEWRIRSPKFPGLTWQQPCGSGDISRPIFCVQCP